MSKEKFTFFWSGPFSQWTRSEFIVDGVRYTSAEQFMMAEKARLFNDQETLTSILAAKDPKTQKALGRKVRGFNKVDWSANCRKIVYKGNIAKFSQNPSLLNALLATEGTTLVEASPYDRIWGIGLKESDPRAHNRDSWQGLNLLGEILTEVRRTLRPVRLD